MKTIDNLYCALYELSAMKDAGILNSKSQKVIDRAVRNVEGAIEGLIEAGIRLP